VIGQGLEHRGRHAGVRPHAGPDDAHPGDVRIGVDADRPNLRHQLAGLLERPLDFVPGDGERDVGDTLRRDVLDDEVHVDVVVGQRPKERAGHAGAVRHAGDRHLGLRGVVRDGGDDGLFHVGFLLVDPRPLLPGERGPDVQPHPVGAGVFD
jgi:hypothetical protein